MSLVPFTISFQLWGIILILPCPPVQCGDHSRSAYLTGLLPAHRREVCKGGICLCHVLCDCRLVTCQGHPHMTEGGHSLRRGGGPCCTGWEPSRRA